MEKVSFDFDDTLEFKIIQNYANELIEKGIDIYIVTTRYEDTSNYPNNRDGHLNHNELLKVAKNLGIKYDHIYFTNYQDKWPFFIDKDFIWHLDDNNIECNMITTNTRNKTKGIVFKSNWKHKCNKLLNITNI
jgi:hypothetical protein